MVVKKQQSNTVLVVDDNPKNVQVLGTILMDAGYQIAVANGGEDALSKVSTVEPDMVLLDIMMPDIDGFEVCRRLKEQDAYASLPIIFLTARTEGEDVVKGFELGAVDYVTKPFKARELLARVKTHLDLLDLRRRIEMRNSELERALSDIRQLSGMLPICANCKKIRDDQGYWQQVELYFHHHSGVDFTHGICPDCKQRTLEEFKQLQASDKKKPQS